MRQSYARIPGWFKMIFAVVMLTCVGIICICLVDQPRLEKEIAELDQSLTISRQREEKQEAEYALVASQLPETQARLAGIQPQADEAKASVDALRAERDALRDSQTLMTAELDALRTGIVNLQNALALLAEE